MLEELLSIQSAKSSIDGKPSKVTVIKLGGSLLDLDDVVDRLFSVAGNLETPVIVVGGGSAADRVRQWARRGLVDESAAHRLAIAAMSLNARRVVRSDTRLAIVASRVEATEVAAGGRLPLLDPELVLAAEQARRPELPAIPESWDVTSDSIAAWLARAWYAELLLLKSCSPGSKPDAHLDLWFRQASQGLTRLTWVNLRASVPEVCCLSLPLAATGN